MDGQRLPGALAPVWEQALITHESLRHGSALEIMSEVTLESNQNKADGSAGDRGTGRAVKPREFLTRLATLIDPKVRIATGFQGLWFFQDSILTLDYKSPDGCRYAFDIRVAQSGISVSLIGRDDSSRYSIRKRCGAFGIPVDGGQRLELKSWCHSTPIETIAIDAVSHLQRAGTAMSTPSPWVPQRSIPSYWWDLRQSFGNLIGPWVVEMLAGRPTHNTMGLPEAGNALVGGGSLVTSLQRPGTTIWGSGLIAPLDPRTRERLKERAPASILAVRGKRTGHELRTQLGWKVPEIYGDPAQLMARLYSPSAGRAVDAVYSLCPHYMHTQEIVSSVALPEGARLINVQRGPEAVVTELATSRAVISTSLYGLIIAQAYGVPWVWLRIADKQLAGDTFKFEDFFTTLDRDGVAAVTLNASELKDTDFSAIAKKARVPRSNFDASALLDAFPYPVADPMQCRGTADVGVLSITDAAGRQDSQWLASPGFRLPVVLISFNRGSMLRRVVDGYKTQSVPVDIFVHDNGSDDPETCAILGELEKEGVVVFRRPKISSPDELNLVDESVQKIFQDRPVSPYVVSDCDVSIADSSPATLQVYLDVLQETPDVQCVGPMLRIDDVPGSYPLYNAMINLHIRRFWSKEPQWAVVKGRRFAFQRSPIDTTLAVYRAGEPFRRLRQGVRMYYPFDARHLDWYPEEHADAYRTSADGSSISNWSNPARERANRNVPIKYTEYRAVEEGKGGALVSVTRTIGPPKPAGVPPKSQGDA